MKDSNSLGLIVGEHPDRESWAHPDEAINLRLWLRLATCSTLIENALRGSMRADFGTTLPRFDLMAHLSRSPRGMKMSELSRCLMVTNGNITGIVDQLERDGLVERNKANTDRRSSVIMLTPEGRQYFRRLSEAYRARVAELFSPMDNEAQNDLFALLAKLKEAIRPQCQAINEAPR